MSKLVNLNFHGHLHSADKSYNQKEIEVIAEVRDEVENKPILRFRHNIYNPALVDLYQQWQQYFRQLNGIRYEVDENLPDRINIEEFNNCSQNLKTEFVKWVKSADFAGVDADIRTHINPDEEIRVIIDSGDKNFQRLPWHLWHFFDAYKNADFVLSSSNYKQCIPQAAKEKLDILAILGDSSGIDIEQDRQEFKKLPSANVNFLPQPQRENLNDSLWTKPCDILFFAGHSRTESDKGKIYINETQSLSIEDLKYALKKAIDNGLQLAIFNSCDGLGLAWELSELNIPTIIVMREPVPDRVAQTFLQYFLSFFSSGDSFQQAFRKARERLQGLETEFPCASWLPVVFHNPTAKFMSWNPFKAKTERPIRREKPTGENVVRELLTAELKTATIYPADPQKVDSLDPTPGERYLFEKLARLDKNYHVFLEHRLPHSNLNPDILLFNPKKGLIVIEVKDWTLNTIKELDVTSARVVTKNGAEENKRNPYKQAQNYAYVISDLLKRQKLLVNSEGTNTGKLKLPWASCVFLYNISSQDLIDKGWKNSFGSDNVICRDEVEQFCYNKDGVYEQLQKKLEQLLSVRFKLNPPLNPDEVASVNQALNLGMKVTTLPETEPPIYRTNPNNKYKVGLDFGTTNSILSYMKYDKIQSFSYGGANGDKYIPSFISYTKDGIKIGSTARNFAINNDNDKEKIESYGNFKMHLPLDTSDYAENKYIERTPKDLIRDYLEALLTNSKDEYSFSVAEDAEIEEIVVSVPELWMREINNFGRERLKSILTNDLVFPNNRIRLISEPVAAAAYYAWQIREQRQQQTYPIDILVCDMGGGTFDVSLCRIRGNNTVEVVVYHGQGEKGFESAGVAFDIACVREALKNKQQENISEHSADFKYLLEAFEETKIKQNDSFTKNVKGYFSDPVKYGQETAYTFDRKYSLNYERVVELFEPIKIGIEKTINEIQERLLQQQEEYNIDSLVFVGGFCQYYLVRKAILSALKWQENDKRIAKISLIDSAYAISYGACLIANNKIEPIEKYPHTLGVYTKIRNPNSGIHEDQFIPLIQPGQKIGEPTFTGKKFDIFRKTMTGKFGKIRRSKYNGDITQVEYFEHEISIKKIYAKYATYDIGMMLDSSLHPWVIIKNSCKEEQWIPLGLEGINFESTDAPIK